MDAVRPPPTLTGRGGHQILYMGKAAFRMFWVITLNNVSTWKVFVAIKGHDRRVKVKFYYGSLRLLRVRVNIFVQMDEDGLQFMVRSRDVITIVKKKRWSKLVKKIFFKRRQSPLDFAKFAQVALEE